MLSQEAGIGGETISVLAERVVEGYAGLRGTFSPTQISLVQQSQLDRNIDVLPRIARAMEEQNRLLREQSRTNRNRFYISTIIATVAIIVGAIIAILF